MLCDVIYTGLLVPITQHRTMPASVNLVLGIEPRSRLSLVLFVYPRGWHSTVANRVCSEPDYLGSDPQPATSCMILG